jgi:peptidyl-prolyl cis-trans isomerase A (cyclophilin A)
MNARRLAVAVALTVGALPLLWAQAVPQTIRVRFETALGAFDVELDAARAPATVASFLKYVAGAFYDGGACTVRQGWKHKPPAL